jgi:hypothetical protein
MWFFWVSVGEGCKVAQAAEDCAQHRARSNKLAHHDAAYVRRCRADDQFSYLTEDFTPKLGVLLVVTWHL